MAGFEAEQPLSIYTSVFHSMLRNTKYDKTQEKLNMAQDKAEETIQTRHAQSVHDRLTKRKIHHRESISDVIKRLLDSEEKKKK